MRQALSVLRKKVEKNMSFKQLKIWEEGINLVKEVYRATKSFPEEEKFGLSSQMRRAAVSVPSNIAEGSRREHKKEFKQFLNITLGSLAELETQIILSNELGYINKSKMSFFSEKIDHISRMTSNLINKLKEAA